MKALIWFIFFLVFAIIRMLSDAMGIILGGVPTALLAFFAFSAAQELCFRYDLHLLAKKARTKGMTVNELVKSATPPEVLKQCEDLKDRKELKSYLNQQLEWGKITKLHKKILYDHYK